MADQATDGRPLVFEDLVEYLASGCKPKSEWRIGAEHEKFGFDLTTLRRPPYEGPSGIKAMLDGLTRFGWTPVLEGEHVIALERGMASISL
ncbi:MAG TPA: glutamate--cysteine ligase, partial [Caulobacteraceae bacterium]|nr:glutamate--cysteine ligase [Caulobacteraceae bacterium]